MEDKLTKLEVILEDEYNFPDFWKKDKKYIQIDLKNRIEQTSTFDGLLEYVGENDTYIYNIIKYGVTEPLRVISPLKNFKFSIYLKCTLKPGVLIDENNVQTNLYLTYLIYPPLYI